MGMVLDSYIEKVRRLVSRETSLEGDVDFGHHVENMIEQIVEWIASKYSRDYFFEPLAEFEARFGKVFPDDSFYHERMSYFIQYCVFEREFTGQRGGQTPYTLMLDSLQKVSTNKDEIHRFVELGGFRHSLFLVTHSDASIARVKDLITGKRLYIRSKTGESLRYLLPSTIFQGFLYPSKTINYLGQGILIHPPEVKRVVNGWIRERLKKKDLSQNEILARVAMTNLRFLRMKHVEAKAIYARNLLMSK